MLEDLERALIAVELEEVKDNYCISFEISKVLQHEVVSSQWSVLERIGRNLQYEWKGEEGGAGSGKKKVEPMDEKARKAPAVPAFSKIEGWTLDPELQPLLPKGNAREKAKTPKSKRYRSSCLFFNPFSLLFYWLLRG